ncbi:MAG TPA: DNA recombination protein RmuC [Candidatus Methylomirabilis sp.]|nr:DNA recombination protein RmuC [Candidatus Methylomirabilis sp.]
MEPVLIALLALGVATLAVLIWFGVKLKGSGGVSSADPQAMMLLQNQVSQMSKALEERMSETNRTVVNQYKASADIIKDVTERLAKLDETNRQVVSFATQLKSLEDILKNPKQRGILGEYFLQTILENTLPGSNHFKMQYRFLEKDDRGADKIVDAVIFVRDMLIPVDAKFSLDNWNRLAEEKDPTRRDALEKEFKLDLKDRIDETARYIIPAEGTVDFAIMFIPAEGVFHSLMVGTGAVTIRAQDLIEYAFKKHVVIVSPSSFYAYLQTILHALKALQIEEGVKDVIKRVGDLNRHLSVYDKHLQSMGNALDTVVRQYNLGYKEFQKIDKDVLRIAGESNQIEPLLIAKPDRDDG